MSLRSTLTRFAIAGAAGTLAAAVATPATASEGGRGSPDARPACTRAS